MALFIYNKERKMVKNNSFYQSWRYLQQFGTFRHSTCSISSILSEMLSFLIAYDVESFSKH